MTASASFSKTHSASEMAAYASFSILITLLLLLTCPSFSSAEATDRKTLLSSRVKSAKTEAENAVGEFNLCSPQQDVNVALENSVGQTSRIVENHVLSPGSDSGTEPTLEDFARDVGYHRLPNTKGSRLFYYFYKSRSKKTDPVVLWLTGGPGCGSEIALFYENGPFHLTSKLSLEWNDFGWDKVSNVIFLDQPTGTGFSYSTDTSDIRHDQVSISNDMYNFLQMFFKKHPQYIKNDFYITGESYAGHYLPALATRIQQGNKNHEGIHINLKGLAIGDGITNPEVQYIAMTDYALEMKLINQTQYEDMSPLVSRCGQAAKLCGNNNDVMTCTMAFGACISLYQEILKINPNLNYFDISKECYKFPRCYDFSNMTNFLRQTYVREALGVGTIAYVACSPSIFLSLIPDWMRNLEGGIPMLLEDGIKLLAYAGETPDMKHCSVTRAGISRWIEAMEWSGQRCYKAAPTVPFMVDGAEAGLKRSYGPLTFLRVHKAGHMAPMDQPQAAFEMIKRWLQGNL